MRGRLLRPSRRRHHAHLGRGCPEEDPGLVVVIAELDTHTVVLRYSGPDITGDPRDLGLPISVDTVVDIVTDPRVAPTTSQEAIDSGEEIDFWLDGNPVI